MIKVQVAHWMVRRAPRASRITSSRSGLGFGGIEGRGIEGRKPQLSEEIGYVSLGFPTVLCCSPRLLHV